MTLSDDFETLIDTQWLDLDFYGWRDPKFARRAYVVLPRLDSEPVGAVLKQAEASPRSRAMCNWRQDPRLPNDVLFWSAKRIDELPLKAAEFAEMLVVGR